MDYGLQDNGASGRFPEFGAIFMSNIQTMKECLKQNVFALPSSHAEFVKHIKPGMVLFLFEYRKRELYGVYQASSEGGVDTVPHLPNFFGQRFPAQVRVRRIWHCDPISEKEFQDAIIENYFSARKFNFGLSKDQVHRLLYLFSSRKKISPQPRSEASVEVAVKNRRLVGDDIKELNGRGYITPTEYELVSSLARGREDEGLVDNRINAEGKVYPFSQGDFLSKRRRIGKEGRFVTNRVAENGVYSHLHERTLCADSPVDCSGDVGTLADTGKVLPVQMANEDQANKIQNLVQSSAYFLDPLLTLDDYTAMQWSTLPDDRQQTFASGHYGHPVGQKSTCVIDGDRFLANDCARRDCTIDPVLSVALCDDNLDECRQAREIEKDKEWLKNRDIELRNLLGCDDSTISAFEFDPSARLLHKIRKTDAAGRFQIDENDPNLRIRSVEASSENVVRPWYRIIEGTKYPIIVDGRPTENMVDKVPSIMITSAGYFSNVDRRALDDARFDKSERVHNQEASHTQTNPIMAIRYPSIPEIELNSSSVSDKVLEKQLSQFTSSPNFDRSRATFDDATITRAVPYLPEYPNLPHGCPVSNGANQNCTSMQKKYPCDGSLENFYPQSSNRLQQYSLKPEKSSSRPLDTALEFGDNGFATIASGLRSSLLRGSSDSIVNPNFSTEMDLNISAPVNYRGSLSSKLSPPCADLENEGKKGLLHYYSKSRDRHFALHEKLHQASENQNKHVPQHGMAMPSNQDFSCSESKDLGITCRLEGRLSSNMNLRELHKNSGANSTVRRESVFSRLSSKEPSPFGEERKGMEVNHQDCYMDATADEVMEMLKPDDNLSARKLRKSQAVGQPRETEVRGSAVSQKKSHFDEERKGIEVNHQECYMDATADQVIAMLKPDDNLSVRKLRKSQAVGHPRETAVRESVGEKKPRFQMETDCPTVEKRISNSASQEATRDSIYEIHKETRILDFKRRSIRKKNLVGTGAGSASHSNCTGAKEDAKGSTNSTLRRKKLIRPAFSRTDATSDAAAQGNETLQTRPLIHGNDDKRSLEIDASSDSAARNNETLQTSALIQDNGDKQSFETDTPCDSVARGDETLRTPALIRDKDDKQSSETDTATDAAIRGTDTSQTHAPIQDKDDKQSSETDTAIDADKKGNDTIQTRALIHGNDDKRSLEIDASGDSSARDNETLPTSALIQDNDDKQSFETDTSGDSVARGNETLRTPALIQVKDDKQSSETDTAIDAGTKGNDTLQTPALIHDKDDKQSIETDNASDAATRGNETLPTPALVHDKEHKQIETATSLCESVVPYDSTTSSNVLASHNHHEEQQDAVVHILSSQTIDLNGNEHGNGDGSSEVPHETSEQKTFVIQTSSVAGVLSKDTDATTITDLNLPEPSLEQVEPDTCCRKNLTEEKQPSKMKIILTTTKKDVKASSQ